MEIVGLALAYRCLLLPYKIIADGTNWVCLPAGSSGHLLQTNGAAAPTWEDAPSGGTTNTVANKSESYVLISTGVLVISFGTNNFTPASVSVVKEFGILFHW